MSTPAKISVSGQRPASGEFSPHYASSFFSPARSPFPAKASVSICPRGSPMLCLLLLFPAKRLFSMLFLFLFDEKRKPRHAPSSLYPRTATRRETKTPPTSIYPSAAVARRPRGAFPPQPDEKRTLYLIEQGLPRGGGLCPLPRPARAFALNHAFCPGYFLPCFSIFALPRRTLKGGQGGTIRRFPLLLSLPFQRERKNI